MQEKRRDKRFAVAVPAEFRGNRVWQVKNTVDMSASGLFLATDNVEPPGAVIELIFEAGKKDKRRLCAQAVVVWNRLKTTKSGNETLAHGMGVRFIKIFPVDGKDFLKNLAE